MLVRSQCRGKPNLTRSYSFTTLVKRTDTDTVLTNLKYNQIQSGLRTQHLRDTTLHSKLQQLIRLVKPQPRQHTWSKLGNPCRFPLPSRRSHPLMAYSERLSCLMLWLVNRVVQLTVSTCLMENYQVSKLGSNEFKLLSTEHQECVQAQCPKWCTS